MLLQVSGVLLVGIPVAVMVLVLAAALAVVLHCRRGRSPRGAANDKLRPGKPGHAGVLTYSNPNYLAERESGAGSSGGGSAASSTTGGSGGLGGYRGWMRRLKYDRSAVSTARTATPLRHRAYTNMKAEPFKVALQNGIPNLHNANKKKKDAEQSSKHAGRN